MKKIIIASLLLVAGFSNAFAQTPERKNVNVTPVPANVKTDKVANADKSANVKGEKAAEIKFESISHDFGTITPDVPVKCTFTFTNTGDAPLIIHQAIATCGCTVPSYSKDPVKPGEKGQIEVTYNGRAGGAGRFMKGITVRSNAKTNPTIRLTIEGQVGETNVETQQ